jgi:hypothetical protein
VLPRENTYITNYVLFFSGSPRSLPAHPPSPSSPSISSAWPCPSRAMLRVHRPSSRGSHERKLLRSRLRVVLGTLYRRRRNPPGTETKGTLGHRRKEWVWLSGSSFERRSESQGRQTDEQTGRQAGQAGRLRTGLPGTCGALNPAGRAPISLG